jgi:hypothetical protein
VEGADIGLMLVADLPFYFFFGLCIAIGIWEWVAGLVAFGVCICLFVLWERSRMKFKCTDCGMLGRRSEMAKTWKA